MTDLTYQQQQFVLHFTSTAGAVGNAAASARLAGYSERSAREIGRQLLDKGHVRDAIDAANRDMICGALATKAVSVLERLIEDADTPPKVRLDAAKTILDRAGYLPPSSEERAEAAKPKSNFSEMTRDELRAFIARSSEQIRLLEQPACASLRSGVLEAAL